MKSYRVRMTEGVEMAVRFHDEGIGGDIYAAIEYGLETNVLIRVRFEDGESVAINPRHVLYVREVAE